MTLKPEFSLSGQGWQSIYNYAPDIAENECCGFDLSGFFPALDFESEHLIAPDVISEKVPQFLNFIFNQLKDRAFDGLGHCDAGRAPLSWTETKTERVGAMQVLAEDGNTYFFANMFVIDEALPEMTSPRLNEIIEQNKEGLQAALVACALLHAKPIIFTVSGIAEQDKLMMGKGDKYLRNQRKAQDAEPA